MPESLPKMAPPTPDFRHVDSWIFDLDNTLYRADSELFALIDARMTLYVSRALKLPTEGAKALQQAYYRAHGSTLCGLAAIDGVDPEEFLAFVHDIDLSALKPDPALNEAVGRLPGRRFVFTNGCRHHAGRVLTRIGLAGAIDEIWDIRSLNFTPKPFVAAYERIMALGRIHASKAAMFDDIARNLVAAQELGMTTVWLNTGSPWSQKGPEFPIVARQHIQHETHDIAQFLSAIRL